MNVYEPNVYEWDCATMTLLNLSKVLQTQAVKLKTVPKSNCTLRNDADKRDSNIKIITEFNQQFNPRRCSMDTL